MQNEPMISIIMPAFNAANFIEETIRSVQNQTYTFWELIIVDDGSTDDTALIIKNAQREDNKIIYAYKHNKTPAATRNEALKLAKGDWIAFLDSDDLWDKNKLEKQILVSRSEPDVDLIYTDGWIFYDNDLNSLHPYPTLSGKFSATEMYLKEYEYNLIAILSVMFKSSFLKKVGYQDTHPFLLGCEDFDYWIRIAKAGAVFYGIPEKLFFYRKHSSGVSSNVMRMRLAYAIAMLKNYDPTLLDKKQTKNIFDPIVVPLITDLVAQKKATESLYLLNMAKTILNKVSYNYLLLVLRAFKNQSLIPLKIYSKLNKILSLS